MRILRCIASMNPENGGPIEGVKQVSRILEAEGHCPEIACLDAPESAWLKDSPFPVHALGPSYLNYRFSPRFLPWLQKHAKDYDAIVVSGLHQFHGLGTMLALTRSDLPYVVFPHGMLDPWFKKAFPLKHLKKWLYWHAAERRVLERASALVFTSEEERLRSHETFHWHHRREAVVNYGTAIPPGDPEDLKEVFFARYPELRGKRLLLFLSRIHPKKGCDLLLNAFAEKAPRDFHLVLAGPVDAALKASLEGLYKNWARVPSISWTGMLTGDLKWGAFHAAEAFILPSHQENFGIAVAEALACGLPVLISNKINIWREIQTAGAGLVEEDDLPGTMRLLERWLALENSERAGMAVKARDCFLEHFEIEKAAHSLLDLLMRVLPENHHA